MMAKPPVEYKLTVVNNHKVIAYTREEHLYRAYHSEEDLNEFWRSEAARYGCNVADLNVIGETS
jgi:hypothetical protein